jgi:3-oxoacyl-[acyl-carrier-protein] synthase II
MSVATARDVVITGLGVVSPIGIGKDPFWHALRAGKSGVKTIPAFVEAGMPIPFGGWIEGFDGKQYVTPRKTMKVMCREIQTAFAAARMAVDDAGLTVPAVDPDRWGVVLGAEMFYGDPAELIDTYRESIVDGQFHFDKLGPAAMSHIFPLWMLKYLPNMPACHIGISLDARGPTNTVVLGEVSSLMAFIEACRNIERGAADVMLTGGTSSRLTPVNYLFRDCRSFSHRSEDPAAASRPFDAARDGMVNGEGAAMLVLESRRHAEARRANILGTVLSYSSRFEPMSGCVPPQGSAIRASIASCLKSANLTAQDIGHVNAHGLSDPDHDRVEARAIRAELDGVPVTAPKSLFGNLGASSGAVEMVASVLALQHGEIPPTLNYEQPDADCQINVVAGPLQASEKPSALILNQSSPGQAVAVLLGGERIEA